MRREDKAVNDMTRDRLVKRTEELIALGRVALQHRRSDSTDGVDLAEMTGFKAASLSFIGRVYGPSHSHNEEFKFATNGWQTDQVRMGIAILESIRDEIQGDWLFSMKGLITAEVFADFLEMADHLLEVGYKDPAAVVAGSVLEEHLRQLCQANGIAVSTASAGTTKPKKAEGLNSDLAKAGVYSKLAVCRT